MAILSKELKKKKRKRKVEKAATPSGRCSPELELPGTQSNEGIPKQKKRRREEQPATDSSSARAGKRTKRAAAEVMKDRSLKVEQAQQARSAEALANSSSAKAASAHEKETVLVDRCSTVPPASCHAAHARIKLFPSSDRASPTNCCACSNALPTWRDDAARSDVKTGAFSAAEDAAILAGLHALAQQHDLPTNDWSWVRDISSVKRTTAKSRKEGLMKQACSPNVSVCPVILFLWCAHACLGLPIGTAQVIDLSPLNVPCRWQPIFRIGNLLLCGRASTG